MALVISEEFSQAYMSRDQAVMASTSSFHCYLAGGLFAIIILGWSRVL